MAHGQIIQTFQKFKHICHTPYGRLINKGLKLKIENPRYRAVLMPMGGGGGGAIVTIAPQWIRP